MVVAVVAVVVVVVVEVVVVVVVVEVVVVVVVVVVVEVVVVGTVVVVGKVVVIDCEKPMKLETSPKVTKSKRSLPWCRSISKKNICAGTFYYSISQKVITLSGRRFITVSGVLLHYRAAITLSGVFLLHYRAVITVSGVYYIIGWYRPYSKVRLLKVEKPDSAKVASCHRPFSTILLG